jgi:PAS domain S-box-containing protein
VLILHIGNPIIEKLEHEVQAHQIARRGLVASEASLRAMVTEVRDYAIFMLDREGRVVSWNAGAQAIKGYAEREIIGRHFSIFYPVDEIEGGKPRRALSTADREGRFEDEGPRLRKDGSIFWANVVITALKEQNGSVSGYLKVTRDVTDKQQASANIKQSLHDKEVLLREIHHRVKNNLQIVSSLLSLQSKHLTEAGAIAALEESRNRINTMAMIHQKLYGTESLEKIDIRDYIQTFARNLFQATRIEPSRVDLKIDVDDVEFDLQQAIPTGMIINELLSNSLKHAFPRNRKGAVHISLHERESLFVLNFKDDGVGFPTEMNPNETESLGLRLVNMFTQQLDGTIQCLCGEGAQFRISFSKHRV